MKLNVSTISPATKFLPDLAAGIFEMAGGMGPDLTRFRILLPTRRACRELRDEFLALSKGKPLLLPRMNPLGDIDQEELDLLIAGTIEGDAIDIIPPALSPLERQMMLTNLVQATDPTMRGEQALSLARALGRLMDQVYTEDLDLANLHSLVDVSGLSEHWGETVAFLDILSANWPLILKSMGRIDSADRRNRLLKLLAEFWKTNPPQTPVIAAGSTGSIPATGNLLHVIAGLPQGHVILPGLDRAMDDESWDNISETHPQNTMKRLLNRMELPREKVMIWRDAPDLHSPCLAIARTSTCPAQTCDMLTIERDALVKGLENISLIEADNARHEAQLIALAVRECLETQGRRAVIITPDRNLARRISASLKRWDINVDDSAGQPLHMKPAGIFLNRILTCVIEDFAPLALLDLLKTPYVAGRYTSDIAGLELHVLRGPRPAPGLEGLKLSIEEKDKARHLTGFIDELGRAFAPLLPFAEKAHDIPALVIALVETAERLTGSTDLWSGADGEALSLLLSELQNAQSDLPAADLSTHQGYLLQFMSERMVRPAYGTHPRITILGQIEARLIKADLMVMAGLNEGTWPPDPAVDPWMSRPMRKKFGLPPVERQTGLSAHDFVQAFCAGEVLMTRARKMDGAPTVPARWLERLSALLEKSGLKKDYLTDKNIHRALAWQKALDDADLVTPVDMPQPAPPLSARPRTLGVTGIEKLVRNPYEIYARHILRLKPLNPIDEDVTAADRGDFIHEILNDFIGAHMSTLPANAEQVLLDMGKARLSAMGEISPSWHYWLPRFNNLVPAFIEHERDWRREARPWKLEEKGVADFEFNGVTFTLTAKADRIDSRGDHAVVIDYKSGATPATPDIVKGRSPQLPLEALILTKGGFAGKAFADDRVSLHYWTITGKRDPLGITDLETKKVTQKKIPVVVSDLIRKAEEGFTLLMNAFMTDVTPYTPVIPSGNRLYDDQKAYKHLARCDEWGVAGDADESEAA